MSDQSKKDGNQHGDFNLLHEELRGAMYRGGADRDAVYTGHTLSVVFLVVFAALVVGFATLLKLVGVNFGEVIATMARDMPLVLVGLIVVTFIGSSVAVYALIHRLAKR